MKKKGVVLGLDGKPVNEKKSVYQTSVEELIEILQNPSSPISYNVKESLHVSLNELRRVKFHSLNLAKTVETIHGHLVNHEKKITELVDTIKELKDRIDHLEKK